MATEVSIKHRESGLMKTGLYGFSWTYLFWAARALVSWRNWDRCAALDLNRFDSWLVVDCDGVYVQQTIHDQNADIRLGPGR